MEDRQQPPEDRKNPAWQKTGAIITIAIIVFALMFGAGLVGTSVVEEITFSAFMDAVEAGRVERVLVDSTSGKIDGAYRDANGSFTTVAPEYPNLVKELRSHNVIVTAERRGEGSWIGFLMMVLPAMVLIGIFFLVWRATNKTGMGTGNHINPFQFGKSGARRFDKKQEHVTFDDVAGAEEAKEELQEVIDFLRNPQKFQALGGRIPTGVLLVGPPGTGKTLLARAVAGEADVPFYSIAGSDFVEMFVGVGASRVRDLFEQGKQNAPCIIFIDELDAVGRRRGAGIGGSHDEREQTLNQMLTEMDGFESGADIIIMAATNRPDVLDPALLRPKRFDRRVVVDRPDIKGRHGILTIHARDVPLADDVRLNEIARGTPGLTGADLENLVNEAALSAARHDRKRVTHEDLEYAKDKIIMGAERNSMVLSDEEKRVVAYHEAGHALVAHLLEGADPLHKVTIIPRGHALGVTQQIPLNDRRNYTKRYLEGRLRVLLGGRVAEEFALGEQTTGAGNDLDQVTDLARKMVTEWGMSEKLGPLTFDQASDQVFLGRDFAQRKEYSERTAAAIDSEIKALVERARNVVRGLIEEHEDALRSIAEALLEREVLDGDTVADLVRDA